MPNIKLAVRRNQGEGRNCTQYTLTVPVAIGKKFDGKEFSCRVDGDQIIYTAKSKKARKDA